MTFGGKGFFDAAGSTGPDDRNGRWRVRTVLLIAALSEQYTACIRKLLLL